MFSFAAIVLSSALAVSAADFQVQVGANAGLVFDPPMVMAAPLDTVTFIFTSKNHTATQSTFAAPCVASAGGSNSGFMFIPTPAPAALPSWTITVNTTDPLWFHCEQTNPVNHCQSGMVFAVNPTADKSFDAFQAAAKNGAAAGSAAGATPGVIPPPTSLPTGGPVAGAAPPSSGSPAPGAIPVSPAAPGASSPATSAATGTDAPASSPSPTGSGALAVRGASSGVALGAVTLFAAVAGLLL